MRRKPAAATDRLPRVDGASLSKAGRRTGYTIRGCGHQGHCNIGEPRSAFELRHYWEDGSQGYGHYVESKLKLDEKAVERVAFPGRDKSKAASRDGR